MGLTIDRTNENGCLEFVSGFEKILAGIMDPFRRCRVGNFTAEELRSYAHETYLKSLDAKMNNRSDFEEVLAQNVKILLEKTNLSLEKYYSQTKKEIAISPDVSAYQIEIEDYVKKLINKNCEKIST